MNIYVLSGQVEWESYTIYGVFGSMELAKEAAEPIIQRFGGRRVAHTYEKRGPLCDWEQQDYHGPNVITLDVKESGADLRIDTFILNEVE